MCQARAHTSWRCTKSSVRRVGTRLVTYIWPSVCHTASLYVSVTGRAGEEPPLWPLCLLRVQHLLGAHVGKDVKGQMNPESPLWK